MSEAWQTVTHLFHGGTYSSYLLSAYGLVFLVLVLQRGWASYRLRRVKRQLQRDDLC